MHVVPRIVIPEMNTIMVDGKLHELGIMKHWRKDPHLAGILPRDLNVSIAWVHLDKDQVLDIHVHPVDSMVVCCSGKVYSTGALQCLMEEGDILAVPKGYRHGLIGAGESGFWGLSIQCESVGLYENLDSPLVTFVPEGLDDADIDAVTLLLQKDANYVKDFTENRLFQLVNDGYFEDPVHWARFLNVFQVWSNAFQRMLLCRAALTEDPRFGAMARDHLADEFGHDQALRTGRSEFQPVWDPILESASQWFITKMLTVDNAEQTVLVHFVLERSAAIFYDRFRPTLDKLGKLATPHFQCHQGSIDVKHIKMGVEILRQIRVANHGPLMELQRRGWIMLNTVFNRIAEIVTNYKALTAFTLDSVIMAEDDTQANDVRA
jgi:quercetin dioxygenase-like cupin family protein